MKTVPNIAFVARRAETCLVELLCFLLAFVRVETIVLLSPPCTNAFPLSKMRAKRAFWTTEDGLAPRSTRFARTSDNNGLTSIVVTTAQVRLPLAVSLLTTLYFPPSSFGHED